MEKVKQKLIVLKDYGKEEKDRENVKGQNKSA